MKKYTALFLALCLAFLCLSGCGSTEIRSYSADGTSSSDTRDMSAVYAAHKPDDVVMTVNGTNITWKEYFYWLNSCVTALDSDNGALIQDWTAACSHSSTGQSYAEYTLDRVKQAVVQYHVMEAKAKELGVELSDADKTSIASSLKNDMANYCGSDATEEDFAKYLESIYMSRDYYDYVNKIALLYYDTFDKLFGANGEKCSDADALSFAKENSYMTANYILISSTASDGSAATGTDLTAKETQAKQLSAQLKAVTDQTQLVAKFKELRDKYTADTSAANYPNGYCFTTGQLDEDVISACSALKEYQVSDPVKTDSGWYILLRLPTTADDVVTYVSDTQVRTLRYYAAVSQYDAVVSGWIDDAKVEYQGDFAKFDLPALLKKSK
jgi:hypothetical protein